MAWDAGAIEASLTIDTAKASSDLDKIEARVKRLTDTPHKIRISAVFDDASTGKALAAFRSLDTAISRDAMQRLRSSPQGSVLGALNALFSPHPVTGAPSPQQAASQGLLGKMFTPQGGGTATPAGTALNNAAAGTGPGNTSSQDMIRQVVTGAGPGNVSTQDMIRQVLTGAGPGNVSTQDMIKQVLTGAAPGNVSTQDMIKQVVTGKTPGNVATQDVITPKVEGKLPGDTATTETVHEKLDEASKAKVIADSTDSGDKAGSGFSIMFTSHARSLLTAVGGMFGGGGGGGITDEAKKGGDNAGKGFISDFSVKILGGIGPVILGLRLKMAAIGTAVGAGLAALPALGGVIGAGLGVALIGGAIAGVVATSPKLKAQFTAIGADAKKVLVQAGAAIVPALSAVMGQIPALLKSVEPQLAGIFKTVAPQIQGVFTGLKPIISGVIGLMQAAAPAFGPFIKSIEMLVANLFPGLIMITKAVVPVMGQFTGIMSSLGKNLGALFGDMAPAVRASMTVLSALLGLIGGLLPVIAKLADIFAVSLAPVIVQFAGVIKALEPTLVVIGKVIADLAGAILGDLVSAFTAVAKLIIGISPALNAFAKAISQVFTVLENTGVFAILGDAIENLAKPLAGLISAFLTGLVPILPPLIGFIGQLSTLIASSLSSAVATLIPPLTRLVTGVFQALNAILPVVLPLLLQLAAIFTGAVVSAVSALATALAAIIDAIPPQILGDIVVGVLALVAAFKLFAIAEAIVAAVGAASGWTEIMIAIALIVVAITELVTHWNTVWGTIKSVASDAASFLDNLFHNSIVQDILAIWSLGLIPLAEHWSTVWGDIESVAKTFWAWLSGTFGTDIENFFTKTIPGWWDTFIRLMTTDLVTPFENGLRSAWTWLSGTFGTDLANFFTKTIPGWFTSAIGFLRTNFVTPFQNDLKAAWTWVVANVFNPMDTFLTKTVPGWFSTAVSDIGSFWDKVEGIVLTPVKFVVNSVLNPIGQTFDDITNALGLGKPIPKLSMASGGRIPGFGGGDVWPALLEPGETVIDKDKSKAYGWLFKMMGVPGYASGGVIPNPIGFIGDVAKNLLNTLLPGSVGAASAALSLPVVKAGLDKILGRGTGGAGGEVGTIMSTVGKDTVNDLMTWLTGKTAAMGGGVSGSAPATSGTVASWILAAMKDTGAPASWLPLLELLVSKESGGNPNAIDPINVDGENASGLFQTLPSTFAEYATVAGGVFNPIADAVAGIRYIMAEYGSPANIPGLTSGTYVGYAGGGMITEPVVGYGMSSGQRYVFGERGNEMVTPASGAGGGASISDVVNRLERLISVASQIPASTGQHVGSVIGGAASAASFRNRYPRGGA